MANRKLRDVVGDVLIQLAEECGYPIEEIDDYPMIYGLGGAPAAASYVTAGTFMLQLLILEAPVEKPKRAEKHLTRALDVQKAVDVSVFLAHGIADFHIQRQRVAALEEDDYEGPSTLELEVPELLATHYPISDEAAAVLAEARRFWPYFFMKPGDLKEDEIGSLGSIRTSGWMLYLADPEGHWGKDADEEQLEAFWSGHMMVAGKHHRAEVVSLAYRSILGGDFEGSAVGALSDTDASWTDLMLGLRLAEVWTAGWDAYVRTLTRMNDALFEHELGSGAGD
jgi:hypothetical protein